HDDEVSDAEELTFAQTFTQKEPETPPLVPAAIVARLQDTHEPGSAVRILVASVADDMAAEATAVETARALAQKGRAIVVAVANDLVGLHEEDGSQSRRGLTD